MLGNRAGFFATLFPGTHERKWRRQLAAVLSQLIFKLFMGTYFSNHTFTCSMLYSPVMEWFDCDTEMLVTKRTWKYDIEEEETVCILGVKFFQHEDL